MSFFFSISSYSGSILSNLLLVLGCSLLAAGINIGPGKQTAHNLLNAQSNTELLQVAILGLAVPSMLEASEKKSSSSAALAAAAISARGAFFVFFLVHERACSALGGAIGV